MHDSEDRPSVDWAHTGVRFTKQGWRSSCSQEPGGAYAARVLVTSHNERKLVAGHRDGHAGGVWRRRAQLAKLVFPWGGCEVDDMRVVCPSSCGRAGWQGGAGVQAAHRRHTSKLGSPTLPPTLPPPLSAPKHQALRLRDSTQVCAPPTAIESNATLPTTAAGAFALGSSALPAAPPPPPKRPLLPSPQQLAAPAAFRAQVCRATWPVARAANTWPPATCAGVAVLAVLPVPSLPSVPVPCQGEVGCVGGRGRGGVRGMQGQCVAQRPALPSLACSPDSNPSIPSPSTTCPAMCTAVCLQAAAVSRVRRQLREGVAARHCHWDRGAHRPIAHAQRKPIVVSPGSGRQGMCWAAAAGGSMPHVRSQLARALLVARSPRSVSTPAPGSAPHITSADT